MYRPTQSRIISQFTTDCFTEDNVIFTRSSFTCEENESVQRINMGTENDYMQRIKAGTENVSIQRIKKDGI